MIVGFVDPGLHAGLGIIDTSKRGLPLVLRARAIHTRTDMPLWDRLAELFREIQEDVLKYNVRAMGTEEQRWAQQYRRDQGGSNKTDAEVMATFATPIHVACAYGLQYVVVTPAEMRHAVLGPGTGNKPKEMMHPIVKRFPTAPDFGRWSKHACDAVAGAVATAQYLRIWNARRQR